MLLEALRRNSTGNPEKLEGISFVRDLDEIRKILEKKG